MDIVAIIQSIWTLIVMVIFLGIVVWAFSRKHQSAFEEAAKLPIDDDDSVAATIKEKHHV